MKKTISRTSTFSAKSPTTRRASSTKKKPAPRQARGRTTATAAAAATAAIGKRVSAQLPLNRVTELMSTAAPLVAPVARYLAGNFGRLGRRWRSVSLRRKAVYVVGTGLVVAVVIVAARRMNARARLVAAANLDGLLKTAHPKKASAGSEASMSPEVSQELRRESRESVKARLESHQQQMRDKQEAYDKSSRIRELSSMHAHGRRS